MSAAETPTPVAFSGRGYQQMSPRFWHVVHVVSFVAALLGLGGALARLGGFLPQSWAAILVVLLFAAAAAHYASGPRRRWVLRQPRDVD